MKFAVNEATATVDTACEAIAILEKETVSEERRNNATGQLLAALPYLDHLKYTYPHTSFPFKLYRVRSAKGLDKDESATEVKNFSYPSPEKCETARANKKGCPVFYVADNPGTALKEAGVEEGDVVYVSEWEVTDASKASLFLFFDHPLPASHSWEKVRAQQEEQFNQSLANTPEETKQKWHQLHKAYCKAFLGEDYQISSLIGHELLHAEKQPDIDILVYPSKVEGEQYCNLAIHPGFADKRLQMISIWKLKITDKEFNQKPELLETGVIHTEKIIWHKATRQEQEDLPL